MGLCNHSRLSRWHHFVAPVRAQKMAENERQPPNQSANEAEAEPIVPQTFVSCPSEDLWTEKRTGGLTRPGFIARSDSPPHRNSSAELFALNSTPLRTASGIGPIYQRWPSLLRERRRKSKEWVALLCRLIFLSRSLS